MVIHMDNHQLALDSAFHALADPTRRAVVGRLVRGPAAVTELASPFAMALPSFMKHLRVLEKDGLIRSEKIGRVRTCRIAPKALGEAERWIAGRREEWEQRLDRLGDYLGARPTGGEQDE